MATGRREAPARRAAPERGERTARREAPATRGRAAPAGRFHRGAEGMARVDEEIAKSKARAEARKEQAGKPYRFRVPDGESRECVILDDKPDFFMYEHCTKGPDGFYNVFTSCVKETENCGMCESTGKESYYAMFLSVLDLTPYTNRKQETVEFSRKLFVVKNQQQKKFMRWYQKEGSLRGLIIECSRDGDKQPAIGNDIEIVGNMDDKQLAEYVREWKDQKGKTHTEQCGEPYDYEALFAEPNADDIRQRAGTSPTPGSRAAVERELNGARRSAKDTDEWEDPDEEGTYARDKEQSPPPRRRSDVEEEPAPRTAGRRSPPARRGAAPDEEEEAPAPRRGARAAPATRTRARPAPKEEVEEVGGWTEADLKDDEYLTDEGDIVDENGKMISPASEAPVPEADPEEEEAPPPARKGRAAPTTRVTRRAVDPEPEEEPEAPPRRVSFRGRR